jgi:site-specific recombinase
MFVTKNQFSVFVACLAFGCMIGVFLSLLNLIKIKVRQKFVEVIIDVVGFVVVAIIFSQYTFSLGFPSIRVYMIVGVLLGIYIYLKSLYILLAKIAKKFYNIIKKKLKSILKAKDERIKTQKNNSSVNRRGSIAVGVLAINNGLSTDKYKGEKRRRGVFNAKNRRV